jgi:hypothetical protein
MVSPTHLLPSKPWAGKVFGSRGAGSTRPGFAMRLALLIVLLTFPGRGVAQIADDFFHGGAQSYIHGQKEKAKDHGRRRSNSRGVC